MNLLWQQNCVIYNSYKIAVFTYHSPHFCFPWRHPCDYHAIIAWMERQFNACQTFRSMYLSIFNSFSKSMRKSKNSYFLPNFCFPGNAPGAITLNVTWMEREFDAYKLPRWMCPYNYNRFSDRARYWSKIVIFHTPLHSTPPLGGFPSE